jgi:uncharacterized membrane protein YidH (DUF202 family)
MISWLEQLYYFAAACAPLPGKVDTCSLPQIDAGSGRLQVILSTFFAILAAAALLVVVIAGLRYVNSAGDPNTMSKTKNTIIYASVGLVVAMSGFAIVNFVLNNL